MRILDIRDNLPKHLTKTYPKRDIDKINHIDIHHSASPAEDYKGIDTIVSFANYHINDRNWPGLGYNHIIAPNGDAFKTGYANESRWSVGNNNSYAISIMVIGNLHEEDPTEVQYSKLLELVKALMSAYNVPVENVKGHNEFPGHSANHCPGLDMDKLREDLLKPDKEEVLKEEKPEPVVDGNHPIETEVIATRKPSSEKESSILDTLDTNAIMNFIKKLLAKIKK